MNMTKFLEDLEKLVNIDCGSNTPEGLQKITEYFKEELSKTWKVKIYPQNDGKNPVLVAMNRESDDIDLLVLGHNDTVYPKGTIEKWKFNSDGKRITGPGVADMKGGVLSMLEVANEFRNEDITIGIVMNTDEEISSVHSRPIIEEIGKHAKYAMIFEPSRPGGTAVIGRKGLIKYQVEFTGVTSHAGSFPEKGINAIVECAHWITEITSLNNLELKNTINVGVIEGGMGVNVVPDYASMKFEGRSHEIGFFDEIKKKLDELTANPVVKGVKVKITEIGYRPPFVPNERGIRLREMFDECKKEMGISYDWEIVGGVSDGNFLSILGVGVVDGLGPTGGDFHNKNEYLIISSIEERINLAKNVVRKIIAEKMENN
ncbi:M20 family metallopeptidase [Fusobacterium sp. PH5-44]|uniref:M20 family metallopeptidase n=1 Tax=unclassified Fusobacterium TaxID=2648384 RepID=UPI003D245ED2